LSTNDAGAIAPAKPECAYLDRMNDEVRTGTTRADVKEKLIAVGANLVLNHTAIQMQATV
jgi:hypothetical protein